MSEDFETFLKDNKIKKEDAMKALEEKFKKDAEPEEEEPAPPKPKPKPKTKDKPKPKDEGVEKTVDIAIDELVEEKVKERLKAIRGDPPKNKKLEKGDKDYPLLGKHGISV